MRAPLTIKLLISNLSGAVRGAGSVVLGVFGSAGGVADSWPVGGVVAAVAETGALPIFSQLPCPFILRCKVRLRPSMRISLIWISLRSSGSTCTDKPSKRRSAKGSSGISALATLASVISIPSHGNKLQPISPFNSSSRLACSRASWRISSL